MQKFTDIVIAVHGIGLQRRFETVRSVANRLAASKTLLGRTNCAPVAPQPLGFFHGEVKNLTSVCLLDDAVRLRGADLANVGFAEVFWADIPQKVLREGRTLEETKAWARTVMARARALCNDARKGDSSIVPPDFPLAVEVLEEVIDTVHVLENLCFLADKAGVFHFDLPDLLAAYVGEVQLVTEFGEHRNDILMRFDTAMNDIYLNHCKDDPEVNLHIVAHSEGTVVSFLGMLHAMSGTSFVRTTTSDGTICVPQAGDIPPWIWRIRGYMTIGSPIDKHMLLWPRLWTELKPEGANELFRGKPIRWRNYYDYGDPVGFRLDTARLWLKQKQCEAFEFSGCKECHHDIGFARYMLPGKAHTDYWHDPVVFEHFINDVVRPGTKPLIVPPTRKLVLLLSPLLPYLLSFLFLVLGVFFIYKAVNTYTHPFQDPVQRFVRFTELGLAPPMENTPLETTGAVLGMALLIAGATLMARLPRLAVGTFWKLFGIAGFLAGGAAYYYLTPDLIKEEVGATSNPLTGAIIMIALVAVAGAVGYLATARWIYRLGGKDRGQRWFFTGMRPLILVGAVALAVIVGRQIKTPGLDDRIAKIVGNAGFGELNEKQKGVIQEARLTPEDMTQLIMARGADWFNTLKKVRTVIRVHPSVWPVLLAGAVFLYLWWLGALVFDLSFVWHRYVRQSMANRRLLEWNPFGIDRSAQLAEEKCERHRGAGPR